MQFLKRILGSQNDRDLKRMLPLVEAANALEPEIQKLSDADLRGLTPAFKQRIENGEPLQELIPETFATVREAMKRAIGKRHFDVQLLGGIVLHEGRIAEMKTGEGKTLVSTLPAYLNALSGHGVHIVTVNDYLATRDAEWMGEVHRFLGLSVGVVVPNLAEPERKLSYAADITYGTNNEYGFDYLRDNMKPALEYCVQRDLHYAIVDEVDSILIDEARTPLIISGPSEQNTDVYRIANQLIPRLHAGQKGEASKGIEETGDYWVDEEHHQATLTEQGVRSVEKLMRIENLYDPQMLPVLHAVQQALSAHTLKKKDVDYVVRRSDSSGRPEVVIVDEFTGRLMDGRRWSDGLHQAVEAKEGIPIQSESQTYASITFQNYFRMYDRIGGMTGTADTEAPEFAKIYDLDVTVVPTNRPMIRDDLADVVYKTEGEKFEAVIDDIKERHATGQPVLVGTISIENSERLAKRLKKRGIKHNVLNAKQHEREAEIVAQAGRKGSVTISTNMAGRGTDIVLGGNSEFMALAKCGGEKEHPDYPQRLAEFETQCFAEAKEVVKAGGLHIIGTERHESRRIDNQLRGRAGRQGDPGSSQFFLSLEDGLLRIFGSERITPWMERLGLEEGEAIEHTMISKAIENAQKKVEARNFDIRKHLLDYDDVMNKQRHAFYGKRREILAREDLHEEVLEIVEGVLVSTLGGYWPAKGEPDEQGRIDLTAALDGQFGASFDAMAEPFVVDGQAQRDRDVVGRGILESLHEVLEAKRAKSNAWAAEHAESGYPDFTWWERRILLDILDRQWKDHLHAMDGLRDSVSLRGYGQKDPKLEYQREGFGLFEEMNARVDHEVAEIVFKFSLPDPQAQSAPVARPQAAAGRPGLPQAQRGQGGAEPDKGGVPPRKIGRNDPCYCGSGKKFKKCCGAA
ncbi:MAG: preprotein translocase subunit SecA [Deltaproteobacteria bacterium]|nr:preprotein translocase subunit SecA [Deltaproteobacteria bacterium]MBW2393102.1 preprotein translocase subunit SecA [Deltaproteobacteria bacterium]